jgi:hypothetical protein
MIFAFKEWERLTSGNHEYRIYATDGAGKFPIHGAYLPPDDENWVAAKWTLNGKHCADDASLHLVEVPEEKPAPTIEDYYNAFDKAWSELSYVTSPKQGHIVGIKAVLELAGVKV